MEEASFLLPESMPPGLIVRLGLIPGDTGSIIRLHGVLYAQECGFDETFEAYVAAGLADFVQTFNPQRDRVWISEREGQLIGSIAIVGRSEAKAQLRWFLIHPDFRGRGLGRALLAEALRFCKDRGYRHIFLWTIQNLKAATHLYRSLGFEKTEEKTHPLWGKMVCEERYDLHWETAPPG